MTRKVFGINCLNVPHSYVLFTPFHAETGRTDVVNTINDFIFTPANKTAFGNFFIVDDRVLEFDELFIAEFNFDSETSNNWNARKGEPSIAFIWITDDDCELCSENIKPKQLFCQYFNSTLLPSGNSFSVHICTSLDVEVNFNESSYTVAESDGQLRVSLRIDGKFFIPVFAIVEVSSKTAQGGLYK